MVQFGGMHFSMPIQVALRIVYFQVDRLKLQLWKKKQWKLLVCGYSQVFKCNAFLKLILVLDVIDFKH